MVWSEPPSPVHADHPLPADVCQRCQTAPVPPVVKNVAPPLGRIAASSFSWPEPPSDTQPFHAAPTEGCQLVCTAESEPMAKATGRLPDPLSTSKLRIEPPRLVSGDHVLPGDVCHACHSADPLPQPNTLSATLLVLLSL